MFNSSQYVFENVFKCKYKNSALVKVVKYVKNVLTFVNFTCFAIDGIFG